jgi:hypothetical protein
MNTLPVIEVSQLFRSDDGAIFALRKYQVCGMKVCSPTANLAIAKLVVATGSLDGVFGSPTVSVSETTTVVSMFAESDGGVMLRVAAGSAAVIDLGRFGLVDESAARGGDIPAFHEVALPQLEIRGRRADGALLHYIVREGVVRRLIEADVSAYRVALPIAMR